MSVRPSNNLVQLMIAAADIRVIPIGVDWPLHRELADADAAECAALNRLVGDLQLVSDAEMGCRSVVAGFSWQAAVSGGDLTCTGEGLLARWVVDADAAQKWRGTLMRMDPTIVWALRQVANRWATRLDTILKNLDTSAALWASTTSTGETSDPSVRQLELVTLR